MEGCVLTLGTSGSALVFLGLWLLANGLGFICILLLLLCLQYFHFGVATGEFWPPSQFFVGSNGFGVSLQCCCQTFL